MIHSLGKRIACFKPNRSLLWSCVRVNSMSGTAVMPTSSSDDIQTINGKQVVIEGTAKMEYDLSEQVFYNKIQVLNRDLSIQVIKLFSEKVAEERQLKYSTKLARFDALKKASETNDSSKPLVPPTPPVEGIHILDALAASGLRSVRYLKEVTAAKTVSNL
jgi:tRNA G26 N,N-dimethylase Trm1